MSAGAAMTILRNAGSQIGGRLAISLGRMLAALLIVRYSGADRFGEYALVINFSVLFEWLVDFGQTDIAVRDICQQPRRAGNILRALFHLKLVQSAALSLLLPALLWLMRYPSDIVWAGLVSGLTLPFYAGVTIFRTVFKVRMRMELDVLAELGGLAVMLPLTWYVASMHGSVASLVACYAFARLVFLLLMIAFDGDRRATLGTNASRADTIGAFRQAFPLGAAGLMVAVYDSMAIVMLSKLSDLHAVAQYAAVTRFVYPVIIVVQSLTSAFYPLLSEAWRTSPRNVAHLQQLSLEFSLLVAGGLFCAVFTSADFLMALIGPSLADAAGLLRLVSVVLLIRSVTMAMSPLIIIAGRQTQTMWLTAAAVLLNFVGILALVPRFGVAGVAFGYLGIELFVSLVPVWLLGLRYSGIRLDYASPVKILLSAVATALLCSLPPVSGTLWGGIAGGFLFLALVVLTGAVSPSRLKMLMSEITRRAAAAPAAGAIEQPNT
jgi:O-antigen/teichoic acid export membrane protein